MNWIFYGLLTLFWGCSFLAIRVALELFPPFAAAGIRILTAGFILWVVAKTLAVPKPASKKQRYQLMGIGIINFGISWACLFWGEQYILPAVASIINSIVPLVVFVFSLKYLKSEKPTRSEFIGVGIGFIGILLVFVPSIQVFSLNKSVFFGMVAVFAMSLAYGFGTVMIRKLGSGVDLYWSFILQAFPAGAFLTLLSLIFESKEWVQYATEDLRPWLGIMYLAVFSSALAWLMYFKLLHSWGALKTSSVTYAMPIVSIAVDWVFLHRLPTMYQLIGAGLILQAIYIMRSAQIKPSPNVNLKAA